MVTAVSGGVVGRQWPASDGDDGSHDMLRGLSVLVAEDTTTSRTAAAETLGALGARVVVVDDGAQVLQKLATDRFDLLMIDLDMPRLGGVGLIERIRRQGGARAAAPIVVLTGRLTRADIEEVERAGADGFIATPLASAERFEAEIAQILNRKGGTGLNRGTPASAPSDTVAGVMAQPVYDPSMIAGLLRVTDRARACALIERAIHDIGREVEALHAALEGEQTEVAASAHRLAGMAGAVGAQRLGALARVLQDDTTAVDAATVVALWEETRMALQRARGELG